MRLSTYVFSFLFLVACNNPSAPAAKILVVANTPEAVAQFWLENYYANNFELAKKYSSPATKSMIDAIQDILFIEEETTSFKITALQCTTTDDNSECNYVYVEADEKIPESVQLKKINGKWLVDAQLIQDDDLLDDLDEEEFKKELDKIMQ